MFHKLALAWNTTPTTSATEASARLIQRRATTDARQRNGDIP